jgi:hypothetical protein
MLKKLAVVVAVVVAAVVVFVAIGVSNLGGIVAKAIETVGPKITKTTVTVAGVSLSPSSGAGEIRGLVLGNPEGYSSPHSIELGSARIAIDPKSILADKVHITSVAITQPVITIEGGLGDNNLKKILANAQSFAGSEKSKPAGDANAGPSKKLQVDDVTLTGAQVAVKFSMLGGKGLTVPLPDIHLTGLGTGPDGITGGELAQKIISSLYDEAIPAVTKAVAGAAGSVGDAAKSGVEKAAKGLGDLFKK